MICPETRCWAIERHGDEDNAYPARIINIEWDAAGPAAIVCGKGARFVRNAAGHYEHYHASEACVARLVPVLPPEVSDFASCVNEGLYIVKLMGRYDEVPQW